MPSARTAAGSEAPKPALQTPNTKYQTPENLQVSNSNAPTSRELGFGDWDFFGVWILVFGVFIRIGAPPSDRLSTRGERAASRRERWGTSPRRRQSPKTTNPT